MSIVKKIDIKLLIINLVIPLLVDCFPYCMDNFIYSDGNFSIYYFRLIGKKENKKKALTAYGIQLFFNFFWTLIFFNLNAFLFAFIWIILLWISVIVMIILFYQISKPAGLLQIPYLLWVTFAAYLNLAIFILNR